MPSKLEQNITTDVIHVLAHLKKEELSFDTQRDISRFKFFIRMGRVLAETYLFYSSLTLFAIGCLTLVLSMFFRLKHHGINSLLKNLSASVFDKTFNVFNPYPEHRKIIHSFLSSLALIVFLGSLVLTLFLLKLFQRGLLLSLVLLIICLNLMLLDFAFETHQIAKNFIKAVHDKASWGVGDLEVFQKLKRVMSKLSNYYLVLSIFFSASAVTLNHIWSLLWLFVQPVGLLLEASALIGPLGWQVVVFQYVVALVIIQIFAWKTKEKVLNYILGPSSPESSKM